MSEPAGGGGGGSAKSRSKSPKPSRYNTAAHVRATRNSSRLPPNVMNKIASHFPKRWWEPVLRRWDALGIAYDTFILNPARALTELPGPLEDGASRQFRGDSEVLAAYAAFLNSPEFKKANLERWRGWKRDPKETAKHAEFMRLRLVNELLCKISQRPYEDFKIVFDAGIDVKSFSCYDNSLVEHLLQNRAYDKFIYAAEHGVDVIDPVVIRKRLDPDGRTIHPHPIFGSPLKQILDAPRSQNCLGALYMLVRHPDQFTDKQYEALRYSTATMKDALLALQRMLAEDDIKASFAADALAPKGDRFRRLLAATFGNQKAAAALFSVFGRHRRMGTASHLLTARKRYINTIRATQTKKNGGSK